MIENIDLNKYPMTVRNFKKALAVEGFILFCRQNRTPEGNVSISYTSVINKIGDKNLYAICVMALQIRFKKLTDEEIEIFKQMNRFVELCNNRNFAQLSLTNEGIVIREMNAN